MRKPSQQLLEALATNIQALRKSNNLSQEELAELCGFHRTYIGSIERCERNVTLSTLEALSTALNTPICKLINN